MPTLDWIGKKKVVNHHLDVPFRVLEKKYTYSADNKSQDSENKIIHGDNLEALKSLLPEYEGKIDCIYIDPPYNTGNTIEQGGWAYNDNVSDPKIEKWLGEVVGKEEEDFTRHDKWLCMMYPRLKLLQKLLSENGAIFISIDDNEQTNLKFICDEIFGKVNFVASIPWRKRTAKSDVPFGLSQDYETILCYAKTPLFKASKKGKERKYFETEDFPGKPWRYHDMTTQRTKEERPNCFFTIENPKTGEKYEANPLRVWANNSETFQQWYKENRIIFPGDYDFLNISKPVLRYWEKDDIEKAGDEYGLTSASTYLPLDVGMTQDGTKEITEIFGEKVFNFPKPSSLIEHLLNIAVGTKPNAIVLDSFAGSGTTGHAVMRMNKKDGGKRKFILIEMMDYAETITAERIKRIISGYSYTGSEEIEIYNKKLNINNISEVQTYIDDANSIITKNENKWTKISKPKLVDNCIKVIATKEYDTKKDGLGGDFSFYELGEPLIINNLLNEKVDTQTIREYIWFTETNSKFTESKADENKYFLGNSLGAAYWFYYEKEKATTLDIDFLSTIKGKYEQYIIYADICLIPQELLQKNNIIFKKIPRDIKKF